MGCYDSPLIAAKPGIFLRIPSKGTSIITIDSPKLFTYLILFVASLICLYICKTFKKEKTSCFEKNNDTSKSSKGDVFNKELSPFSKYSLDYSF